ncbi:MAG: insulinase family protein [Oscillospiraceae bacterium]|nr:insulinase family protein [Oscillospiraceae bacterium]
MNIWEELRDEALEERYFRVKHPSGLEIQVLPKEGYSTSYALFSAKYGSIDTAIPLEGGGFAGLPEGTAHFLEHKLFESEDLDAFARFAKTGASANAYTSFQNTSYLFSCAERFEENLEILLDFVQSPYFTQATVEKEQGIIGQEIRMYQDEPGWECFFRLLRALYASHPVRIDIAGTEGSIAEITAELLHKCYRAFYNLNNMILTVAGNVTPETVLAIAERTLKPAQGAPVQRRRMPDPEPPPETVTRRAMAVATPRFLLGFKETPAAPELSLEESLASDIVLDALAGECSPLYEELLRDGLINGGFSAECFCGFDFTANILGGESAKPEQAAKRVGAALLEAAETGLEPAAFERARKKAYGRLVMDFNDIDGIAGRMTAAYFDGRGLFDAAKALRELTLEETNARLKRMFRQGWSALSIIEPIAQ